MTSIIVRSCLKIYYQRYGAPFITSWLIESYNASERDSYYRCIDSVENTLLLQSSPIQEII